MYKTMVLFLKELKSIFYSPIAYVVGSIFAILNGYTFWIILNLLNDPSGQITENIVELFFGGTIFFWIGLLIIIPILTMRTISEEKKSGTIELLFTAPIKDCQVVLAKFLSILAFYIILWAPTLFFILFIKMYGPLDLNMVASSYLGVILLGSVMISCGILASAITKNQIIAATLTFALLIFMFSIGFFKFVCSKFYIFKIFRIYLDHRTF